MTRRSLPAGLRWVLLRQRVGGGEAEEEEDSGEHVHLLGRSGVCTCEQPREHWSLWAASFNSRMRANADPKDSTQCAQTWTMDPAIMLTGHRSSIAWYVLEGDTQVRYYQHPGWMPNKAHRTKEIHMPWSFVEKTLPKAQWTLGLSSAYQSNFFWSYKNLDQISESRPRINFKISTKRQHFN